MKVGTLMSLLCALCIVGCDDNDRDNRVLQDGSNGIALSGNENCTQTASGQSILCGSALAADGITPIIGAEISLGRIESNSIAFSSLSSRGVESSEQCLTDSQGEYSCILPNNLSGNTFFQIAADGFDSKEFEVNIVSGDISTARPQVLNADSTVQWAVAPGNFDGIQVLLAQLKGCTLTDAMGNDWNDDNPNPALARGSTDCESKGLRVLERDETAFYTDGSLDQFDALFINCDADRRTLAAVNSAIESFNQNGNHVYFSDLSDAWLDVIFPDRINFAGNATFVNPAFEADVVDVSLSSVVGENINLVFDFDAWTAIDSVSEDTSVYIEGDISSISNYDGVKPITVGFKPEGSEACVFYTSYHIEGASTGSDQELAIKFLIQNIEDVCV